MNTTNLYIALIVVAAMIVTYHLFFRIPFSLWIYKLANKAKTSFFEIILLRLMKLKQDTIKKIIKSVTKASREGFHIRARDLGHYCMAGVDVERLTEAMTTAHKSDIPVTFDQAFAMELAGYNVLEVVNMSLTPVTDTFEVSGMAKDGVQLRARCRARMFANLNNYAGPGRETTLARLGTAVVSIIGIAENHRDILANPSVISARIMGAERSEKIPDINRNAAFKVVSLDIVSVNVAGNTGAALRTAQAEAAEKAARIREGAVRTDALTREKQTENMIQEKRVEKMMADAQVPRAFAEAIRSGQMSVDAYFRMRNVNSDAETPNIFESSE